MCDSKSRCFEQRSCQLLLETFFFGQSFSSELMPPFNFFFEFAAGGGGRGKIEGGGDNEEFGQRQQNGQEP